MVSSHGPRSWRWPVLVVAMIGMAVSTPAHAAPTPNHAPDEPVQLTVGDRTRPLNVEGVPQFGWQPTDRDPDEVQSAYQILVRTSSGRTVWDSGRVTSDRQEYVRTRASR